MLTGCLHYKIDDQYKTIYDFCGQPVGQYCYNTSSSPDEKYFITLDRPYNQFSFIYPEEMPTGQILKRISIHSFDGEKNIDYIFPNEGIKISVPHFYWSPNGNAFYFYGWEEFIVFFLDEDNEKLTVRNFPYEESRLWITYSNKPKSKFIANCFFSTNAHCDDYRFFWLGDNTLINLRGNHGQADLYHPDGQVEHISLPNPMGTEWEFGFDVEIINAEEAIFTAAKLYEGTQPVKEIEETCLLGINMKTLQTTWQICQQGWFGSTDFVMGADGNGYLLGQFVGEYDVKLYQLDFSKAQVGLDRITDSGIDLSDLGSTFLWQSADRQSFIILRVGEDDKGFNTQGEVYRYQTNSGEFQRIGLAEDTDSIQFTAGVEYGVMTCPEQPSDGCGQPAIMDLHTGETVSIEGDDALTYMGWNPSLKQFAFAVLDENDAWIRLELVDPVKLFVDKK